MKIKTVNVPRDLRRATLIALPFYHDVFFPKKAQKRVELITVKFLNCKTSNEMAYCDYEEDGNRLPTEFVIEINNYYRDIKISHYCKTLFHEMTHARQYTLGQLRSRCMRDGSRYNVWKGERFEESHEYFELPWEQEAYGVESCAWNRFYQVYPEFKIHARRPHYNGRLPGEQES